MEKNKDTLNEDVRELILQSKNPLISNLFQEKQSVNLATSGSLSGSTPNNNSGSNSLSTGSSVAETARQRISTRTKSSLEMTHVPRTQLSPRRESTPNLNVNGSPRASNNSKTNKVIALTLSQKP